jgi:hypothetical protein
MGCLLLRKGKGWRNSETRFNSNPNNITGSLHPVTDVLRTSSLTTEIRKYNLPGFGITVQKGKTHSR